MFGLQQLRVRVLREFLLADGIKPPRKEVAAEPRQDAGFENVLIVCFSGLASVIVEMPNCDPSIAYQIKPRKWEAIIAGAYERAGFDGVILTPHSEGLGRKVIAVKRGICTVPNPDHS